MRAKTCIFPGTDLRAKCFSIISYRVNMKIRAERKDVFMGKRSDVFREKPLYNNKQLNDIVKREKMKLLRALGFSDLEAAKDALSQSQRILQQYEKAKDQLKDLAECRSKLLLAQQMLFAYKQREIARNYGVKEAELEFVIGEVNCSIADDDLFLDKLRAYARKHPNHINEGANNDRKHARILFG